MKRQNPIVEWTSETSDDPRTVTLVNWCAKHNVLYDEFDANARRGSDGKFRVPFTGRDQDIVKLAGRFFGVKLPRILEDSEFDELQRAIAVIRGFLVDIDAAVVAIADSGNPSVDDLRSTKVLLRALRAGLPAAKRLRERDDTYG